MASPSIIATTPTELIEEDPLLLYEPIAHQISGKKIPWTIEYEKITPAQAAEILQEADEYEKYGQRPRTAARLKRWKSLMDSSRFVEYFPFGPLGFNEDGIVMNGGNRLGALAMFDKPLGFMIIRNCPTWLINYIDNGNNRTQRESSLINRRATDTNVIAAARLGMRYEEFLFGKRKAIGWADWSKHKDEYVDTDNFVEKREYLLDFIPQGKLIKKVAGLQPASAACFIAYQHLAWPDGADKLQEFLDGLIHGSMLEKGSPALTLREWGYTDGFIGGYTHGRREGHLLLLFKHFTLFCEGQKINEVRVAKGLPMSMPYHPEGWDVACKNAREALMEMG
jgi:hypothetical protein